MQFKSTFISIALLALASPAMSATITGFAGAGCTGAIVATGSGSSGTCLTLGSGSVRSISFSGVTGTISFFESGGLHDNCSNGSQQTLGGPSGCSTAPTGFNWESVSLN
ncbi:hypothetical protein VKT23_009932 [Stygiomarasmius scandens]|uniref:Uncharacterized protein n=1 Tax=Marasmiellus scandens TaxID=2682957 RepID=A0ABR1JFX1_9AGAR